MVREIDQLRKARPPHGGHGFPYMSLQDSSELRPSTGPVAPPSSARNSADSFLLEYWATLWDTSPIGNTCAGRD